MDKLIRNLGFGVGCLLSFAIMTAAVIASWLIVCGIVYAITLCFGWAFSWLFSTAAWLLFMMIAAIGAPDSKKKRGEGE